MERFREVLLDVWREACRHIEIHESTGNIARLLAKELPLAALLVRRLDPPHMAIDTVAIGEPGRHSLAPSGRTTFSDGETAAWWLDQTGRLGLDPSTAGYRPNQQDVMAFQVELEKLARSQGM